MADSQRCGMKIVVYRHPDCSRCARIEAVRRKLNWLGRAEFSTAAPASGPLRLGEVVVEKVASGQIRRGYSAFRLIARTIPAYLPLRVVCIFPAVHRHFARQLSAGTLDG